MRPSPLKLSPLKLHRSACIAIATSLGVLTALAAPAWAIDVSLNLVYANPADPQSGGTWEVVAKSGGQGIAGLNLWFDGILSAQSTAPRGTVNGSNDAGFGIFQTSLSSGHLNAALGQAPLPPGTNEQSMFYGVGTLQNGAPNYDGKPLTSISIGPHFSSLSGVSNVPWAATPDVFGDATWNSAAKLLAGSFGTGATPAFFSGPGQSNSGTILSSLGTSTTSGSITSDSINAIVRSNLIATTADADYNGDGIVNAADYTVWRNMLGQTGTNLAADGAGPGGPGVPDGLVDRLDYDFWKASFGQTVPGSGSGIGAGVAAVPEASSLAYVILASIFAIWRGRNRQ